MTRKEEIIGESYKVYPLNSDKRQAFIRGAKYADQNPKDNLVDIDKVCEWLDKNIGDYYTTCEFEQWFDEMFIDLRKAMKGE